MSSSSSLWRAVRLLRPATQSSFLATGSKAATAARARGSVGPPAAKRPSYLSAEIAKMKQAYEEYNESPPKPFKLKRSGSVDLLLTRRKGPEDIQVKCALSFDPRGGSEDELFEDELDDEEGRVQKMVVNITMTITKGGGPQALEVNVDCDRRGYIVNNIIYRDNKDSKVDDEFFPAFWRIGPQLRSEFHNFLEQRGLDEIFACWVHDQMDDKAHRERLRQLENIHAFVENEDPKQQQRQQQQQQQLQGQRQQQ